MTFRLACADFTFPLLGHDQVLQLVALLGFQGVDIGLFEGRSHRWPSQEFQNIPKHGTALNQRCAELGLEIADVFLQTDPDFRPFAINHPGLDRRQHARDLFLKTLEYAAQCNCKHVTALPGVHFEEESRERSFGRSVEELAWRVEQSQRAGIVFGTEAHVGSIAPDPETALHLVQATPGLTLTLDYTHFTRAGIADQQVECLLPYASHFHCRGAKPGRLQVSFQQNTIDYHRVAQRLQSQQYLGWIGIEYIWIDWEQCNECDTLSESIQFRDLFQSYS